MGTRERIIEAADELFYQGGYEHTSFADIADAVGITRGNFYYYFKAKDEILDAVIAARLANTEAMLEGWQAAGETPAERVRSFINILIQNADKIKRSGCPVGTLTSELAKLNHEAQGAAGQLFTLFRTWLARQFTEMGHAQHADVLAMHLLARSQGVATLANAFEDDDFVRQEVEGMQAWLERIAEQAQQ